MKKILVVDDEVYIINILDFCLGMDGFWVITALGGEQAIQMAITERPDLIIMDMAMPGVSGLDALRLLKANAETAHIPVIILTERMRDENVVLAAGAAAATSKPFSPRRVAERVKSLLK